MCPIVCGAIPSSAQAAKLAIILKTSIAISTTAQLFLNVNCVKYTQMAYNASNAHMDTPQSISNA